MKYELIGKEGVKELAAFAGGYTPDSFLLRTRLKRFEVNRGEVCIDLNTVRDLIEKAKGLREYAHLDRADLIRPENDFSKKLTPFSLCDLYQEEKPSVYKFVGNQQKNFALKAEFLVAMLPFIE